MSRADDDPLARELLRICDTAYRNCRRFTLELRRLYLDSTNPDQVRAAILQQTAHEAIRVLQDTLEDFTKFGWELTPIDKDPKRLELIAVKRQEALKRIKSQLATKNVVSESNNQTIIITNVGGKRREFRE